MSRAAWIIWWLLASAVLCAALVIDSPKGKEQRIRRNLPKLYATPPLPPMPTAPLVPRALLVVPPTVKTQKLLFYWIGPDEYHQRISWKSNGIVLLQTNYTVLLKAPIGSNQWQRVVSTTATNYLWTGTNNNMLFRLTAEWR